MTLHSNTNHSMQNLPTLVDSIGAYNLRGLAYQREKRNVKKRQLEQFGTVFHNKVLNCCLHFFVVIPFNLGDLFDSA